MKVLVSWDPGLRESGYAVFQGSELIEAGAIYARDGEKGARQWVAMAKEVYKVLLEFRPDTFVFEQMQTRRGRADAHAALIELSIISGMVAGLGIDLGVEPVAVPANVWTKGRNKLANQGIIEKLLGTPELQVLEEALEETKKTNHKEVYDAIGIGLYSVRRWR